MRSTWLTHFPCFLCTFPVFMLLGLFVWNIFAKFINGVTHNPFILVGMVPVDYYCCMISKQALMTRSPTILMHPKCIIAGSKLIKASLGCSCFWTSLITVQRLSSCKTHKMDRQTWCILRLRTVPVGVPFTEHVCNYAKGYGIQVHRKSDWNSIL